MDKENMSNEELPTGASVFGDEELPTGASVFGDALEPLSASVFGDADSDVSTEVLESSSASVFGDAQATDQSPVIGDWTESGDLDLTDGSDGVPVRSSGGIDEEPEELSTPLTATKETTEVTRNRWGSSDENDESESVESSTIDAVPIDDTVAATPAHADFGDDVATGEPIALDVEPTDEEGLGPWSDLSASDPDWDERNEPVVSEQGDNWDPGTEAETADEPTIVKIRGAESEKFFGFDGQPGDVAGSAAEEIPSGGSDLQSRILTGLGLLTVVVIAIFLGPLAALALIVGVVALSAGEFYNALRVRGYNPATLLGLSASVAMPIAVYFRGTQAVALVMALTIVFGLLWYLFGVGGDENIAMNLGVTVLGVVYIGVLGSFGAAMLETSQRLALNNEDGTGLLLAAVILTMGYDVGAFFSGRSMGRTPLTKVSPNKTVEGLVGGAIMTVVASVVFLELIDFLEPFASFGGFTEAIILGVAAAIMAPLGDLAESLIKRDLGIKDMGSVLPGHGGFLDRFDALLFVLPTVYFVALAFFYQV